MSNSRSASATGDGWEDRHLAAIGDRRLQPVEEADVLPADVDVDEAPERPVVVGHAAAQLAEAVVELPEHLLDRRPVDLRLAVALGGRPELGRDLHRDRHQTAAPAVAVWASLASN